MILDLLKCFRGHAWRVPKVQVKSKRGVGVFDRFKILLKSYVLVSAFVFKGITESNHFGISIILI